jgi:hypothetical protein
LQQSQRLSVAALVVGLDNEEGCVKESPMKDKKSRSKTQRFNLKWFDWIDAPHSHFLNRNPAKRNWHCAGLVE